MNINLTLIGQMITFSIFVWFTMKYVWPPLMQALAERQKKIADGLAAAERGVHEFELAQHKSAEYMRDAKKQAATIVENANLRAEQIIAEAKQQAITEGERLMQAAKVDIEKEFHSARAQLQKYVSDLAIACAEKVVQKELDTEANRALVEKLIKEI